MPKIQIIRNMDQSTLMEDQIRELVKSHVESETGRKVYSVTFHASPGGLDTATIIYAFEDGSND